MHIACVCTFEEVIPYEEFLNAIDSKLHLLPRYRQIAVSPPFGIGYPNWEYDRHFDIRRHIIRVTANAPGDDAELEDLAGRILSVVMNRDKPLWEVYVVEGLSGGRGALIAKVHHSLADGIAGASLLRIMLDPSAEGSQAIRKPHFQMPAPKPQPSLADAIASAIHSSLENLVAAEAGLLGVAQRLVSEGSQQVLQGLVSLLPEIATPVPRLPFNKPCGGERKFCWAEFDFADIKAIRTAVGGTVNDVILTVTTRAVARYVKHHGEPITGRLLRMVCPVSIRKDEKSDSLGNQISFLPLTLPMDVADPVEHLKAVALRSAIMKSVHAAELVGIAASWLGAAPPPAQAFFWWGIPLVPMPAPLLNMICTNVPGSPTPLYCVGKRMLSSYPHVPTGYELGVGVAVQSYNGKICFGLTADAVVAADVKHLRDFIRASWQELCRAVGMRTAPRPAATPKADKPARARSSRANSMSVEQTAPVQEAAPVEAQPVAKPARVRSSRPNSMRKEQTAPVQESAPVEPQPVDKPARARSPRPHSVSVEQPASLQESAPVEAQPVAEPARARSPRANSMSVEQTAPVQESAPVEAATPKAADRRASDRRARTP